jgi:hypothetical protein
VVVHYPGNGLANKCIKEAGKKSQFVSAFAKENIAAHPRYSQ